jgi:uncharacterized cupin superfamily protein
VQTPNLVHQPDVVVAPARTHPGGEQQLEPWDIVFFPPGPDGAHQVRNNSASAARIAMFSSTVPVGAVVYPDSDMVRIFSTDGADDILVERKCALNLAAAWPTGQPQAKT